MHNSGNGWILAPGQHGKQEETKVVPATPNRAARRTRAQNMKRQVKHLGRMFVLTCPSCQKPYIAPVALKCACPVRKPGNL
jgi:hypothetical protein